MNGGISVCPVLLRMSLNKGDIVVKLAIVVGSAVLKPICLAMVVNLLDPDVIVLGGGLSKVERLYTSVPILWKPYVFSDTVKTLLLPPQHGDASGVRGAALLGRKPTSA